MKVNLKEIFVKARINRANNQINFNLPRKQMTKEMMDKINSKKTIKLLFEDFD